MYRFVEHTAELELELEAGSAEGILLEALRAFAELVGGGTGEAAEFPVAISANDLPSLLAFWLDELLFLAETEQLVPDTAEIDVDGTALAGVVRGRRGEPSPLVKGVTLHRLRFRPENGAWRGRVVLDV
jgi:SHS2 domain-containing protein